MTAPTPNQIANASHQAHKRIESRIFDTPVIASRLVPNLFFKTDNFQRTGSFKIRGAMSKLTQAAASGDLSTQKFVTASSGNHGIGAATAAVDLGADMTVVLPENVAPMKLERIKSIGATVIIGGTEAGASELHAQALADNEGYTYISPYNDPDIMAGQGTIGVELLAAFGNTPIDNIFISLGGGGLVSGIGSVLKQTNPSTKVWGVSAINSAALDASMKAGTVVETEHLETLADAVAGGVDENTITLAIAQAVVDETLLCNEQEIEDCLLDIAYDEGMVVEGAAALALAGFRQVAEQLEGQTSVILLCGGNISREQAASLLAKAK